MRVGARSGVLEVSCMSDSFEFTPIPADTFFFPGRRLQKWSSYDLRYFHISSACEAFTESFIRGVQPECVRCSGEATVDALQAAWLLHCAGGRFGRQRVLACWKRAVRRRRSAQSPRLDELLTPELPPELAITIPTMFMGIVKPILTRQRCTRLCVRSARSSRDSHLSDAHHGSQSSLVEQHFCFSRLHAVMGPTAACTAPH